MQPEWEEQWLSVDNSIIVTDSAGIVYAVSVGSTTVIVIIINDKNEKVATLEATVIVRDNIERLKIIPPKEDAFYLNHTYDFNRSYVTYSGSATETTSITRWFVDSGNATISDAGLFVASVAGDYTITARSFASEEDYEVWKATRDSAYITAFDTYAVTVN
jgi:hypothetical protein